MGTILNISSAVLILKSLDSIGDFADYAVYEHEFKEVNKILLDTAVRLVIFRIAQAISKTIANFFWQWFYLRLWARYTSEVRIKNDQQIDELAKLQSTCYNRIFYSFIVSIAGISMLATVSPAITAKLTLFLCPGVCYCIFGSIQIAKLSAHFSNTRTTADEASTEKEGIRKAMREGVIEFFEQIWFYMAVIWILWYGAMQVLWQDNALDPISLSDFITFVVLTEVIIHEGFWELTKSIADLAHITGPANNYEKLKRALKHQSSKSSDDKH